MAMSKKSLLAVAFILIFVISSQTGIQRVSANFMPFNIPPHNIEINADGIVTGTDRIQRNGMVYTFGGNISGSIVILCDGITIDGAGYTLQSNDYSYGIFLEGRKSVTIKNTVIDGFEFGVVYSYFHSWQDDCRDNVLSRNNITNNKRGVYCYISRNITISGNTITHNEVGIDNFLALTTIVQGNTISKNSIGIKFNDCDANIVYGNNFIDNIIQVKDEGKEVHAGFSTVNWSIGTMGNFWSDHFSIDTNHDGIADTPYVISQEEGRTDFTDPYPLMAPYDISSIIQLPPSLPSPSPSLSPSSSPSTSPSPSSSPTSSPTPSPSPSPSTSPTSTATPNLTQSPTPIISPSNSLTQQPSPSSPPNPTTTPELSMFSMPKEYLNYTILSRDGIPWAVIDGTYPIYYPIADETGNISMVYPTPPGTTNITIKLNNTQLNYSNFTQQNPNSLHHTAIGDWGMIETTFTPSNYFVLAIHYEHPITQTNESYQFLYDLNISPYLSPSNPNSTAYFNLKFNKEYPNLQVFTAPIDSVWNTVGYATQTQGNQQEVTFSVISEYSKSLPGDVIVTFEAQTNAQNQAFQASTTATILIIVAIASIGAILLRKKHRKGTAL
jgi:parallel beta-helix repeat protein